MTTHSSLVTTLNVDVDGGVIYIHTICGACGETVIAIPLGHLAMLAVTLIAACNAMDIDTASASATVLPFATAAAREAAVAAYARYVKKASVPADDDPESERA